MWAKRVSKCLLEDLRLRYDEFTIVTDTGFPAGLGYMDYSEQSPSEKPPERPEQASSDEDRSCPYVERGACYLLFAYDIGLAVNLNEAETRITETRRRYGIRSRRHAPAYFEYNPPPICLSLATQPLTIGRYQTTDSLEAMLYDFGAISITYRIPLHGPVSELLALSGELYDNQDLLEHVRRHVEQVLTAISPAVSKPQMSAFAEDYVIYQIESTQPTIRPDEILRGNGQLFAQILRSESGPLSEQEISDALSCRLSFGPEDLVLIDWNSAMVFDTEADDVRAVLEFANVELLEMRVLDNQLDAALNESYLTLAKPPSGLPLLWTSHGSRLRRVAELQMDAALLFEGVNNALKLLGDQYLARLYRATSRRLHLDEWDSSILRKLQSLDSIYEKMSDHLSHQRLELLEWIIIVLIALSILASVLLTYAPH